MRPLAVFLLLATACADKGGDDTSASLDGGALDGGSSSDGGSPDGGGGDGGGEEIPVDECDDRAGERFCIDEVSVTCDDDGDVAATETCKGATVCQDDEGCVSCAVAVDAGLGSEATEAALVRLDPDAVDAETWTLRAASMRPVTLSVDPTLVEGAVVLQARGAEDTGDADGGAVALWSIDGEPLGEVLRFSVTELPATVYVQGLAEGEVTLEAVSEGCDVDPVELPLRVGAWRDLAGRSLDGFPWLEKVRSFSFAEEVQVGLDPAVHGDLAGRTAQVYVVAHRSAEEWAADPSLVEVDEAETVSLTGLSIADDTWTAWGEGLEYDASEVGTAYDVVLDLDGDGLLSAGDLFEGPGRDEPAFWVLGDLSSPGPWKSTYVQYSGGAWLGQRTYYPAEIDTLVAAEGPRPIVIISHGNGHNYTWYDYLGHHLASWGYVVMAHQNNTGPGIEYCSLTTLTNTEYLLGNLDTIADGVLDGMLDTSRIAWVGHSRGGEGVTRAYDRLLEGDVPPTISIEHYTTDDIVFISSIAPTVFLGVADSNPHDRWYHLIAGGADGDVTGGPSSGVVQYQRLLEVSTEDAAMTYVHGASHNDFNCCGTADGTGPDLIGRDHAQILARSVYLALLEWVVEGNEATADLITRPWESFGDAAVPEEITVANTWRPGASRERWVLDDFQTGTDTTESSMGTAVTATVDDLVEGLLDDADTALSWGGSDPMNGMTLAHDRDDTARGAVFSWSEEGAWRVALPDAEGSDLRDWTWISLRAAQGSRHPNTAALDDALDFSVVLTDAWGHESAIRLQDARVAVTDVYPRTGLGSGAGWSNEWNTVRLRLQDFTAEGRELDLSAVTAVELRFGGEWGSAPGRLGIDDLMLVND